MKIAIMVGFLALTSATGTHAQDDNSCGSIADGIFLCPVPQKPAPPPRCHVYGDNLICTAPVDYQKTKPVNCGWGKAGKYICW